MHRQILGYIPANLVPAAISFLMIYAYTRILTPAAFGHYSLAFSVIMVAQISFYHAMPTAVMRLYPAAQVAGRPESFLKEVYAMFYAITVALTAICVVAYFSVSLSPDEARIALMSFPLLVLRSSVVLNQVVNRSENRMGRYNLIECMHAMLGFALGLGFIQLLGPTAEAVLLGLLVAALACVCIDLRLMASPFYRRVGHIDLASVRRVIDFSWPVMAVSMTSCLLLLSDRFVLGSLGSSEMLGIYAVAYALVERPITLICLSISTATYSLAVQILERQGREAGRRQSGKNGMVLLAVALPACVGLAMTSPHVAGVLVGPAFQAGVAGLIPIMCFTALCQGVRAHFIDHAFHFAGRPNLMLWSYGPAALANIGLNLVLVPHYGMDGAAWVSLVCQIGAAAVGCLVGCRVFPLWLPMGQVLRILVAVVAIVVMLSLVDLPLSWAGLLGAIGLGGGSFGIVAALLNVGGLHAMVAARWRRRPG